MFKSVFKWLDSLGLLVIAAFTVLMAVIFTSVRDTFPSLQDTMIADRFYVESDSRFMQIVSAPWVIDLKTGDRYWIRRTADSDGGYTVTLIALHPKAVDVTSYRIKDNVILYEGSKSDLTYLEAVTK